MENLRTEPAPPQQTQIEGLGNIGQAVGEILNARARGGIHDDTSSFGDAFGRSHSGSTLAPSRPTTAQRTRRVGFMDNNSTTDRENSLDDGTVATLGTEATTGSTRKNLRHQVEINNAIWNEGVQIAEDRDRLQDMLSRLQDQMRRHGINPNMDDATVHTTGTPDQPSAIRVPPSTGADSAGGKN